MSKFSFAYGLVTHDVRFSIFFVVNSRCVTRPPVSFLFEGMVSSVSFRR